mmetsp:Transcript_18297/g.29510  ORF Transcript_18297/g.29510 Transcript_18297/m.29510 type:complete len:270 (+) Transcript_18297:79-888(+)
MLSVLPPIPPRYYSVSSSPLDESRLLKANHCRSVTVAFSVVDYLTPSLKDSNGTEIGRRRIHGIATSYLETICSPFLASKKPTASALPTLRIFPKPTQDFRLPSDPAKPLVLIGPGTGIAPFMGFLVHRKESASKVSSTTGLITVFSGCRYKDHDWLYHSELQALQNEGVITNLYSAFSRDGETKEYVQDIMKNDASCSTHLVETIVTKKGYVYICGDGNRMAHDVQQAIADVIGPHVDDGADLPAPEKGKMYIETMKKEGKFLLDIWS